MICLLGNLRQIINNNNMYTPKTAFCVFFLHMQVSIIRLSFGNFWNWIRRWNDDQLYLLLLQWELSSMVRLQHGRWTPRHRGRTTRASSKHQCTRRPYKGEQHKLFSSSWHCPSHRGSKNQSVSENCPGAGTEVKTELQVGVGLCHFLTKALDSETDHPRQLIKHKSSLRVSTCISGSGYPNHGEGAQTKVV